MQRDRFDKIVDKHLTELPEVIKKEMASCKEDFEELSWDTWLIVFREILHDLCDVLGLPGDGVMKALPALPAE